MAQKHPLGREVTCEEQAESSALPHGADAGVLTCTELLCSETEDAIVGHRDTQPWASRPRERKGVKSRKGGDSLGDEFAPRERNDCNCETCHVRK